MTRIIKDSMIKELNICEEEQLSWVNEALVSKKSVLLPPKVSVSHQEGHFYNTMPVIIPSTAKAGVKVVTRYPYRNPTIDGDILLYDLNDGNLLALVDAAYITLARTAAVAVHTIKLLAKTDFEVVSWIGLGDVARATVKTLLKTMHNRTFTFQLHKYSNRHIDFINYINEINHDNHINFEVMDSYEEVIKNTDVLISCVSYVENDFAKFDVFPEGILVLPIHTRGFMECDYYFDKVVADDIPHISHFRHFDKYNNVCEVADILLDPEKGRNNDMEKIIAYNIGIAIHDIYFASKIYELINDESR